MENHAAESKEGLNEARAPAAAPAGVAARALAPADVTAQAPAPANVTAQAPAPRNVATLAPTSANAETPETDVKDAGKLSFPCFRERLERKPSLTAVLPLLG